MRKPFFVTGPHNILFVAGIVGCLFFLQAIFHLWYFECEIRILSIELVCQQPLNNRCQYEYLGQYKDGTLSKVDLAYMFRRDELAIGDSVKKDKFSFEYQLNGKKIVWEFANHYLSILFFSLLVLGLWRYLTSKPATPKAG
jgi:hypothetical protein